MTTIYSHPKDEHEGDHAIFPTVKQAIQSAQRMANECGIPIEIMRHEVAKRDLTARDLVIALLTGDGWCKKSTLARVCLPKRGYR